MAWWRRKTRRKVALLGAADPLNFFPLPLNDPTWEIWGCNNLWHKAIDAEGFFRGTRWFEMHPYSAQSADDLKGLKACPVPVYMLRTYADIPMSRRFPFAAVMRLPNIRPLFTCTFCYQIALCIWEGNVEEIALHGIALTVGREHLVEKGATEWWLGYAAALGITITIPSCSPLATYKYLYGYDYKKDVEHSEKYLDDFLQECFRRKEKLPAWVTKLKQTHSRSN